MAECPPAASATSKSGRQTSMKTATASSMFCTAGGLNGLRDTYWRIASAATSTQIAAVVS